jgi:hypothetical protein
MKQLKADIKETAMKYFKGLLIVLLILAISSLPLRATPVFPAPMSINRSGTWLQNAAEGSWFVWNSELYYVYTDRNLSGSTTQMKVVKPTLDSGGNITGQTDIATFGSGYGCQDVIVDSGTLYVFASNCKMDFTHLGNSIVKFSSTNLTTWTGPSTIYTAEASGQIYNAAIGKDASGNFVLGYDLHNPSWYAEYFVTRFATSTNLTSWSNVGTASYVWRNHGCADLQYVNGAWHIWGFNEVGSSWSIISARTTDFLSFANSRIPTIKPVYEYEDINTSDPDMIEFGGKTYIMYLASDQTSYMRLSYATFPGTISQLADVYQL